jgi:hypothetical protein
MAGSRQASFHMLSPSDNHQINFHDRDESPINTLKHWNGHRKEPEPADDVDAATEGSVDFIDVAFGDNVIYVNVSNEVKSLLGHHLTYTISSRYGSSVQRRYSNFLWLNDILNQRYPFRLCMQHLLSVSRSAKEGSWYGRSFH